MSNDIYIIKDNAEEDEEDLKELMKVGQMEIFTKLGEEEMILGSNEE